MLYLGAPLAVAGGVSLANARARRIHRLPIDGALSAYDVELKVRYYLHAALWGHEFEEHGRMGSSSHHKGDVEAAASHAADGHDATGEVVELARRLLTPQHLAAAEAILRKGCEEFRKSAMMHIFVARFHQTFSQNKHLHMRWGIRAIDCRSTMRDRCLVSLPVQSSVACHPPSGWSRH